MKRKKHLSRLFVVLAVMLAMAAELFVLPASQVKADGIAMSKITVTKNKLNKAKVNISIAFNGNETGVMGFKVKGKKDGISRYFVYVPIEELAGLIPVVTLKTTKKTVRVTAEAFDVGMIFSKIKDGYTFYSLNGLWDSYEKVSFGRACIKDGKVYVPLDAFVAFASFMIIGVDYTLNGRKLNITFKQETNVDECITGGWNIPESVDVPKDIAVLIKQLSADYGKITPVALLSTQVTKGINYRLLVRGLVEGEEEEYDIIVISVDLDGNAKVTDVLHTGIASTINNLPGGMSQPESVAIDPAVSAAFTNELNKIPGIELKPIACIGSQVVKGMNYISVCETKVTLDKELDTYTFVYVYADIDGTIQITDIKTINPEGGYFNPLTYGNSEG